VRSVGVAIWPRLLLGEDWASGESKVCPLLEGAGPRARRESSGGRLPLPEAGLGRGEIESRLEGGVDRRNLKIKTLSPN
jgi:hypothetical protein